MELCRNLNTVQSQIIKIEWLKWKVKWDWSIPIESTFENIWEQFACLVAIPWWCQECSTTRESRCSTRWHLEWVFRRNAARPFGTRQRPFVVTFVCDPDWCSTRSGSRFSLVSTHRGILKFVLSEIQKWKLKFTN